MARVTSNTPDPAWLLQLDQEYAVHLDELRQSPVIQDGRRGHLVANKARGFMLQIGRGIIEAFPVWLGNMLVRANHRQTRLFLRANCREEREHWRWWEDMARHYGIQEDNFDTIALNHEVAELNRYLTNASTDFHLACAMGGINFAIETGAAILMAEVAPGMSRVLNEKERLWIEAHASGDPDHSADSRELIKLLVQDDLASQEAVRATVNKTGVLFTNALRSAYA